MSGKRMERVSELIKEALGEILTKIKDPRIGFVTITHVEVTPDLEIAKVFVSIYGERQAQEETLAGLDSAAGYVRRELGHKIRLKKTPKVVFKFDPGIERAIQISQIIDKAVHHTSDENREEDNASPGE